MVHHYHRYFFEASRETSVLPGYFSELTTPSPHHTKTTGNNHRSLTDRREVEGIENTNSSKKKEGLYTYRRLKVEPKAKSGRSVAYDTSSYCCTVGILGLI